MKFAKAMGIGLTAGCLLCSVVMAQDEKTSVTTAEETTVTTVSNGNISQIMKKFDTDGDGVISDAEKQAAINQATTRLKAEMEKNPEIKTKLLAKFDADKDGALSDAEIAIAVKQRMEKSGGRPGRGGVNMEGPGGRPDDMMMEFDTDGDGVLSDSEKQAALTQTVTRLKTEMEKDSNFKAKLIEKFDADKDGALSDSELKTAIEQRPQRGGPGGLLGQVSGNGNMEGGMPGGRNGMKMGEKPNLDTDGDGKISDAEKQAALTDMTTKLKEKLEQNSELKTKMVEKFDADKDGVLSDSELKTAIEQRPQRGGQGGPGGIQGQGPGGGNMEGGMPGGQNGMKMGGRPNLDTDGDGKISDAERQAAVTQETGNIKERMEKDSEFKAFLISKFDADKDGTLNDSETKAAAEQGISNMEKNSGGETSLNQASSGDNSTSSKNSNRMNRRANRGVSRSSRR